MDPKDPQHWLPGDFFARTDLSDIMILPRGRFCGANSFLKNKDLPRRALKICKSFAEPYYVQLFFFFLGSNQDLYPE
jgi:hypothetical protein